MKDLEKRNNITFINENYFITPFFTEIGAKPTHEIWEWDEKSNTILKFRVLFVVTSDYPKVKGVYHCCGYGIAEKTFQTPEWTGKDGKGKKVVPVILKTFLIKYRYKTYEQISVIEDNKHDLSPHEWMRVGFNTGKNVKGDQIEDPFWTYAVYSDCIENALITLKIENVLKIEDNYE